VREKADVRSLVDSKELNLKCKVSIGRDHTTSATSAIAVVTRDDEASLLKNLKNNTING
jgi:hypothetical protein